MSAADQVKNFFGFSKLPFSKGLSVNELYKTASLSEAIARLDIAVENEEVALITGVSGSGKSNMLRFFVNGLDTQEYRPVYMSAGKFKTGEVAKRALTGLNAQVPFHAIQAIRKLHEAVTDLYTSKHIKTVLIIDEVQELSLETILGLKTFLNYQMDNANHLFMLLCGHKSVSDTLAMMPLESFNRRIRIRYELQPLNLVEVPAYIGHHLKMCGITKTIFSDEALALVFQISRGLPSAVNKICFDAIIHAAIKSQEIIEKSIIELVSQQP